MIQFDHPIQIAPAVGEVYNIAPTTITRAYHRGLLGNAAYRSKDIIMIDTTHEDFYSWLAHYQQEGRGKKQSKDNNAL